MISFVILLIWYLFEKDKRLFLKNTEKAKKKESKALQELSTLLQIFPQGLLILDKDMKLQYKNDFIDFIIKEKDILDFLSETKVEDSTLINKIKTSSTESLCSSSLGISVCEEAKFEWCLKLIFWKKSLSYMITVKDVTKILNFERIASANKTKNEIIRSISHEFRTPINGILLIIDDLKNEVTEAVREKFQQIRTCTSLVEFFLNDILDYSELCFSKFTLNFSDFDLKAALETCLSLIRQQAFYKRLELIFHYDSNIPKMISSDQYRLQKAIINLMSNSLKFTQNGFIQLSAFRTSRGIKIEVSDSGLGLSSSQISKNFKICEDPNCRTSGIGLYICKKILKYFNSKLLILPQEIGCLFQFTIGDGNEDTSANSLKPDSEIPSESPGQVQLKVSYYKQSSPSYAKLLIVDDDEIIRMFLSNSFKRKGIPYLEATNGLQAIEVIIESDRRGMPITCCIMDCNMPVMDGWESSQKILKLAADGVIQVAPSIIAHTAYSSERDKIICKEAGMVDYISKPTAAEEIMIKVSKYIR
jgi:CheY-like chemotaxis protein/nitrogen-specific signal transduction histidine kinase